MYTPVPTHSTCAQAWLAACHTLLNQTGHETYNVVLDVAEPTNFSTDDAKIVVAVDQFLQEHKENPVATVANTIFPWDLYQRYGSPDFYDAYKRAFARFTTSKKWGRYFERMITLPSQSGDVVNPLEDLVSRVRQQVGSKRTFRSIYELNLYDPIADIKRNRGRQCLSFLSFKVDRERGLLLTAIYRNHHYVARLLGNLIGLARLQAFVAKEGGTIVGSLTCISTHAVLDTKPWKLTDVRGLLGRIDNRFCEARTPNSEPLDY